MRQLGCLQPDKIPFQFNGKPIKTSTNNEIDKYQWLDLFCVLVMLIVYSEI